MPMSQEIGWVYLMRNEAMPGLVKIGMTFDDPRERANQLSAPTSVPMPFEVVHAIKTKYPSAVETMMHDLNKPYRIADNREFFRTDFFATRGGCASGDGPRMIEEDAQQHYIISLKYCARVISARTRCERTIALCRHQLRAQMNEHWEYLEEVYRDENERYNKEVA